MMQDKIRRIKATGASTVVACDAGCLLHLGGGLQRLGEPIRVLHLAQLLGGQTTECPPQIRQVGSAPNSQQDRGYPRTRQFPCMIAPLK
jgi:L-lactate dehydrogenase complex protein LldE